jgi:hypothetical protein
MQWLDDLFTICVGKPRWVVEGVFVVAGIIAIHFGYSLLAARHERLAQAASPAQQQIIQTGPITTYGPNAGVSIGGGNPPSSPTPAKGSKK